jgi:GNAT superfamily N-acetyltransferase
VRLRPGTIDDVAAVCAVAPDEVTERDVRDFLTNWSTQVALDADDRVVGAAGVLPASRTYATLGVGRAYRTAETGELLAGWLVRQAPHLHINVVADDTWTHELLERFGFRRQYPAWKMERSLADPLPDAELPAGLGIRTYDETHFPEFVRCYSEVYADQRFVDPHDEPTWRKMLSDGTFRTDLSVLAINGSKIAGFVFASDDDAIIEIGPVGTRREWRGRGVSTALLVHAMAEYRAAGIDRATLWVDGESPTGAMRIYQRLGFAMTAEILVYER